MSLEHAPDRGAYSVRAFCQAHNIGRSMVYREIKSGRLRIMKVGKRTLVSVESAAEWRNLMEGAELDPPPKGSPRRAGNTNPDNASATSA